MKLSMSSLCRAISVNIFEFGFRLASSSWHPVPNKTNPYSTDCPASLRPIRPPPLSPWNSGGTEKCSLVKLFKRFIYYGRGQIQNMKQNVTMWNKRAHYTYIFIFEFSGKIWGFRHRRKWNPSSRAYFKGCCGKFRFLRRRSLCHSLGGWKVTNHWSQGISPVSTSSPSIILFISWVSPWSSPATSRRDRVEPDSDTLQMVESGKNFNLLNRFELLLTVVIVVLLSKCIAIWNHWQNEVASWLI